MEFTTIFNFIMAIIFIGFIIYFGGVKAWCSTAVIASLAMVYYGVMYISREKLKISDASLFVFHSDKPTSLMITGGLFACCYLIVIALCVGFSRIKPVVNTPANVAKIAAQNGALFIFVVYLFITVIPYLVHLFGNTFGYMMLDKDKINSIIIQESVPQPSMPGGISKHIDYSFLITFDYMSALQIIETIGGKIDSVDLKNQLQQLILRKTAIGHFVWVSLASIATVITTLSNRTFYG